MAGSASSSNENTVLIAPDDRPPHASADDPPRATAPGTSLGRYIVIEELGRGGMGVVLRAYDPKLQREVALKVLRARVLDAAAQARLVREARAMARLNHPNVVAIYDVEIEADAHDAGVVLVMEYVPGTTLRGWIDAKSPPKKDVIAACIAAGRGLAAAHDEGLLHRDFKLDNVLVGTDARVRVTDFGLARLSDARASSDPSDPISHGDSSRPASDDSGALTEVGYVMGTPLYMPPEQAEGAQLDARADQYAFCVALWLALTQRFPFEGRGHAALWKAKVAGVPPWPNEIAVPRHVADAIRRGLAPNPDDRWPNLPALLAELERDPSRRRHATAAIGVLAAIGAGAWGLDRLADARRHAACAREGDGIEAVWNHARADAIADAFAGTGIAYARDTWDRSRARIDAYAEAWHDARTRVCEADEPTAEAARACLDEHREDLGALLEQLATPDPTAVQKAMMASASLPRLDACTDVTRLRLRPEPPSDPKVHDAIADLRARLAATFAARMTGRYDAARRHASGVLDDATALSWTPLMIEAQLALGDADEALGHYDDATAALKEAFFAAVESGRDQDAQRAATALVVTLGDHLARTDEALEWGRMARALGDRWEADDLANARLLGNLARVHKRRGDFDEALTLTQRSLELFTAILGPDHPNIGRALDSLGLVHYAKGEYTQALAAHERALVIMSDTFGPDHPEVAAALHNIGVAYLGRGEDEQATQWFSQALVVFENALGPEHPNVAATLTTLGAVRFRDADYAGALKFHERALAIRAKTFGVDHPQYAASLTHMGNARQLLGEYDAAVELYERALAIIERALGPEHPEVALSLNNIGAVHHQREQWDEAVTAYERALALRERVLGPEHPDVAQSLKNLALVQHERGAYDEAIAAFERVLTIRERAGGPADDIAATRFGLARTLWQAGRDHARAAELMAAARVHYESRGLDGAENLAMIDEWATTHRVALR